MLQLQISHSCSHIVWQMDQRSCHKQTKMPSFGNVFRINFLTIRLNGTISVHSHINQSCKTRYVVYDVYHWSRYTSRTSKTNHQTSTLPGAPNLNHTLGQRNKFRQSFQVSWLSGRRHRTGMAVRRDEALIRVPAPRHGTTARFHKPEYHQVNKIKGIDNIVSVW